MARNFIRANDDYAEHAASAPVTAAPFTISAWCKTDVDTTSDDYCVIQIQDKSSTSNYWRITAEGAAYFGEFMAYANDSGAIYSCHSTPNVIPAIGTWYHVAFKEIASNSRAILVNGGSKGTNANECTPDGSDSITIGYEGDDSPGDGWDGDIAEVAVWDAALSDEEIGILAEGYSPLLVRPENLVFYAPLLGRTSPEIELIGGRTLTLSGTTAIAHPPVLYAVGAYTIAAPAAEAGETLSIAIVPTDSAYDIAKPIIVG